MDLQFKHLDEEELIHFAANASQQGRQDAAISALKEVLLRNPKQAQALYLLAAEHAELGLYQRAIAGMQEAINHEPSLHAARLQLGLLHLTMAQTEASKTVLQPLADNDKAQFYQSFAKGLLALQVDDFSECVRHILQGISQNNINAPLNKDMQRILDALVAKGLWSGEFPQSDGVGLTSGSAVSDVSQNKQGPAQESSSPVDVAAALPLSGTSLSSLWLSAYQQDEHQDEPSLHSSTPEGQGQSKAQEPSNIALDDPPLNLDGHTPPKGSLH